ncbi:MAG: iron chelate uptake ABC transporter family permease subunit, partial [Microbacteriaceae bacterium]|nr:iron chelate uptake ABC transporter family permease subunit [Microbacteriaceae bacterium]
TALIGTALIGATAGILGCYTYLRRQSLLADVLSHSALPGVYGAFMVTALVFGSRSKAPLPMLLAGAALTGLIAVAIMRWITAKSRLRIDAAMATSLSLMYSIGLLLAHTVDRMPLAGKGGLKSFMLGNAATLTEADIATIGTVAAVALLLVVCNWRFLHLSTFDGQYARTAGLPHRTTEVLLATLTVIAAIIGVKIVGVILTIALVVAPAAAARQWTNRLRNMVILAGFFGVASCAAGTYISVQEKQGLPSGPVISLVLCAVFAFSLLFAPRRSLLVAAVRRSRLRKKLRQAAQQTATNGLQADGFAGKISTASAATAQTGVFAPTQASQFSAQETANPVSTQTVAPFSAPEATERTQ